MKGFVISTLACAVLVALAVPRGDEPAPGNGSGAREPFKAHLAATAKPQWYGGEMVLDRAGDGHFYADVTVDSSDYRMLIDTGATVVALTGEDAEAMGLEWDADALAPVAQGASGPIMGVPATIPDMAVGDFEVHNVQAIIVPDGLPISLLGQSFLEHVPKVEIADDTLKLSS
jgi:aspartyl protease family protein